MGIMRKLRQIWNNRSGAGFLGAIVLLLGVMFATIIGAIVFFAFSTSIEGTSDEANDTIATVITYAVIVFGMLALVPLILIGGLMLRSLGFFGGGGGV
jgi:uncharacterized membrane protein YidH (DUF202 family)